MPPYQRHNLWNYFQNNSSKIAKCDSNGEVNKTKDEFKMQIVWKSVFKLSLLHIIAVYGIYKLINEAKYQTVIWAYAVAVSSAFGILCGAHRLWSHRSYKAHFTLRCFLMILQTLALQNDIYEWARDHRVHHKFAETDADPHNSKRGFFFAHMGWLMVKKHPQVIEKGQKISLADLTADPIVRFQRKYYMLLVILIWGIIPSIIPYYFWSEGIITSFAVNMSRYAFSLHQAWLVNSAAHIYGSKPYDHHIEPRENLSVVYLSLGEGYHNYHHSFPYDYSASEFGWAANFNIATAFIDFFAYLGLAYDRKVAANDTIHAKKERSGDVTQTVKTEFDLILGTVVSTWPLWVVFALRAIFM